MVLRWQCWRTQKALGPYRDGELSPQRRTRVERHIEDCLTCRAELAQVEISRARWPQAQAALDQALRRAREAEPRWLAEVESTAAALAAAQALPQPTTPTR